MARQRARELHLAEGELVVTRRELDALRDDLYVLACAVDDVERDLGGSDNPTRQQLQEALDWLLEAAQPLRDREVRPPETRSAGSI